MNFTSGVNVIAGGNAQGKTNLLEAIYFLSTGRSFRTTHFEDLIKEGKEYFYIEAKILKENIEHTLKISFDKKQKKIQHNETTFSTFSSLLGILPSVLQSPQDFSFIYTSPQLRRRFINLHIAQHNLLYVYHLARFSKALKQRNHILRMHKKKSIECWEEEMSKSAAYLVIERQKMIQELQPYIVNYMQFLSSHNDTVTMQYQPSVSFIYKNEEEFFHKYKDLLQKNRQKDIDSGHTQFGPHRDDFSIFIKNKHFNFASEGQKRTFLSALRLSEWSRLKSLITHDPIMSIDDFGIHLDKERSALLKQKLHTLGQVFLTTPVTDENLLSTYKKVIFIENGTFL